MTKRYSLGIKNNFWLIKKIVSAMGLVTANGVHQCFSQEILILRIKQTFKKFQMLFPVCTKSKKNMISFVNKKLAAGTLKPCNCCKKISYAQRN